MRLLSSRFLPVLVGFVVVCGCTFFILFPPSKCHMLTDRNMQMDHGNGLFVLTCITRNDTKE